MVDQHPVQHAASDRDEQHARDLAFVRERAAAWLTDMQAGRLSLAEMVGRAEVIFERLCLVVPAAEVRRDG